MERFYGFLKVFRDFIIKDNANRFQPDYNTIKVGGYYWNLYGQIFAKAMCFGDIETFNDIASKFKANPNVYWNSLPDNMTMLKAHAKNRWDHYHGRSFEFKEQFKEFWTIKQDVEYYVENPTCIPWFNKELVNAL